MRARLAAVDTFYNLFLSQDTSDAHAFLEQLLINWRLEGDDLVRAEATIGLAFADIKLRAECHSGIRGLALEALSSLLKRAEKQSESAVREDWVRAIGKMESKLRAVAGS